MHMAQGQLDEAKGYCHRALELLEGVENLHMRGITYQIMGKVASVEARQVEGTQRVELLEAASRSFEKALSALGSVQEHSVLAEVYTDWAAVLEDIGRIHKAIECWRCAYHVLSSKP